MPFDASGNYLRVWKYVAQFVAGESIDRADVDIEMDDVAAALTDVGKRTRAVEQTLVTPGGNLILNPLFAIDSLGYSGAALALGDYAINRWKSGAAGTTFTAIGGVATITAGAIEQVIDGRSISTGTHVISWTGTAQASINGVDHASGDTVDLTAGTDVVLTFRTGTVDRPQLVLGSVVKPFLPRTYAHERALCTRVIAFEDQAAVAREAVHESIVQIVVYGNASVTDGGTRIFKRVAAQPGSGDWLQSVDGAFWAYVSPIYQSDSLAGRVTALEQSDTTIMANVATNDTDIAALQGDIQRVDGQLGDHDTRISAAQATADQALQKVTIAVPTGAVLPFAMQTAPTGWLKCNGAAVSRVTYSRLFAAIGTAFGAGDGSTTFNIPDLRGVALRGLDDGRGLDPSRALGTFQEHAIQRHKHEISHMIHQSNWGTSPNSSTNHLDWGGSTWPNSYTSEPQIANVADETRMSNVSVLFCIKV